MSTPPSSIGSQIKAEESKLWAWLKANVSHFVTWIVLAWQILGKHL